MDGHKNYLLFPLLRPPVFAVSGTDDGVIVRESNAKLRMNESVYIRTYISIFGEANFICYRDAADCLPTCL